MGLARIMTSPTSPFAAPSEPADASAAVRTILSTRVFAASREAVWAAFSDPVRLAQWWGPKGFTNTMHEFDLRPGGCWRSTLHAPDGADYENQKTFTEVVPVERVVFRHHQPTHDFEMAMTLIADGSGTRVEWRMVFESAGECAQVRPFIEPANEQNFDRLAAHLVAPGTVGA